MQARDHADIQADSPRDDTAEINPAARFDVALTINHISILGKVTDKQQIKFVTERHVILLVVFLKTNIVT
jgi:hypothetical protein